MKSSATLKKIDVLLTDISQYSVLHHFSKKLHEALRDFGIDCRLLTRQTRHEILTKDPPQLTIAFNGLPAMEGEDILCDLLKVPHLAILVDPPHWGGVFIIKSPYMILGCDDAYGCTFLENMNFYRSLFIPHAVEKDLTSDPAIDKIYEAALLASFIDYEAERASWEKNFPPLIIKIMEEASEETFANPNVSFIQAFVSNFYSSARKYSFGNLSSNVFLDALQSLERYIKGKDRSLLVKALPEVPLHIFSNNTHKSNWRTYLGDSHPNVHVHDAVEFDAAIEIMKRTKILLNPSLKNKQGSHERFFTGTACGALVLSSESQYLKQQFKENEEVLLYQHPHLDKLNGVIIDLLKDDKKRNAIADRARAKVMLHHTWEARITDFMPRLIELVNEINQQH